MPKPVQIRVGEISSGSPTISSPTLTKRPAARRRRQDDDGRGEWFPHGWRFAAALLALLTLMVACSKATPKADPELPQGGRRMGGDALMGFG